MSATTTHDLTTYDGIRDFLEEILPDLIDTADAYGEPGYDNPEGDTPMVVLGSYWCRCKDYANERFPDSPLHDVFAAHYPREAEQLLEQGVVFEWYDEWVVVHEYDQAKEQYVSNAYRVVEDSYHWQPSAILDEDSCEFLTPNTPDDEWVEWALNDHTRCIPAGMLSTHMDFVGWEDKQVWYEWDEDGFENGWHPGQDADPEKITDEIRARHGEDTDVVFVLTETSQFYIRFTAYYSLAEADEQEVIHE